MGHVDAFWQRSFRTAMVRTVGLQDVLLESQADGGATAVDTAHAADTDTTGTAETAVATVTTTDAISTSETADAPVDRWTPESVEAASAALQRKLSAAQSGIESVRLQFGGRFTSGREESIGPLEHMAAVSNFVPQMGTALVAVQQQPSLLRLVSVSPGASHAKARFALAGLSVAKKGSPKSNAKSKAKPIVSAWLSKVGSAYEGAEHERGP